ncbi:MAG: class I SAM-dependent methyltransferase [Nanoarchaeota archaeon]|nr:class I SAM-dependent methyltransferase [Nanoarchaeota archaeon]
MKNKNFFYQQYEKIKWENQEKTKINSLVNNFIIKEIISKHKHSTIRIFDIGFGIGFFIKMLSNNLAKSFKEVTLAGCEPSDKNYNFFINKKPLIVKKNVELKTYNNTFQDVQTDEKFDFVTAIYVFPHFSSEDLEKVAEKIYSMLNREGKFILVVANEKYLAEKLKDKRDLFIENNIIKLDGKEYKEVLHYSDIPQIGKLIDYNREEQYYLDLFKKKGLKLTLKKDLDDNGFICTVFVFEKSN